MIFKPPGNLQELTPQLLQIWNDRIMQQINRQSASRFFQINPEDVLNGQEIASVRWSGAPAEPRFCLTRDWALKLSGWGVRGRHETQNEYCEYKIITSVDRLGNVRPKRVEFTSELREYWVVMAVNDPDILRLAAADVLGRVPEWSELYDHSDPGSLSEIERRIRFSQVVAGHGNHQDLIDAGVPSQPIGAINRDNALFMTHPINGLDDLIYVVMFGARPYRVNVSGIERKALLQEVFRHFNVEQLACRNADPAAAAGPFDAVSEGRNIAFSANLGMYLRPLNRSLFEYNNQQIPEEWIKYGRGAKGMYQRLVFGPGDGDDIFLDDILIRRGAAKEAITGGYIIAEMLEVGPLVVVGDPSTVDSSDITFVNSSPSNISCSQAQICNRMRSLKAEYQAEFSPTSQGVRGSF